MLTAPRAGIVRYLAAAAVVLLATLARWSVDHLLDSHLAFASYYCAVAVAVWYGGWGPAFFSLIAGLLLADYLFVPPLYSLGFTDAHDALAGCSYLVTGLVIIAFGRACHTAYQRQTEQATQTLNQQLRRRVAELEGLLNLVPVGVAIAEDSHGRTIRPNRAMAELLGVPADTNISMAAPAEERPPWKVCRNGRELAPDELPLHRSASQGVEIRNEECQCVFDDGRLADFQVYSTPLFDESGRPRGCIGVLVDITQRKRLEAELRERAEQLAQSVRRKDEYLAMLGHELRNPLAGILNGAQVLRMTSVRAGVRAEDAEQMCDVIERQAAHMASLVDDLLDVARISSGKVQLRTRRLELVAFVSRTVETHRPHFAQSGLNVRLDAPDCAVWVEGDPVRLAQVIGNLIQNARKFTDPGGEVAVTVASESGTGQAVVKVKDTGIGMEPDTLGRIFEPFTQADRSLDRTGGGLGLGLTLVKGLVELHGGQVTARSDGLGRGSEFCIRLPLAPEGLPVPPPPEQRPRPARPLRVLVIDDRRDALVPLRRMLELLGHEVESAAEGRCGMRRAKEFRPEVVLCDIGLPEMDGYAVAQAMRADTDLRSAYLVAVTGYGQEEDRRRAAEAGFDYHLAKPVAKDRLERLLSEFPRFT